MATAIFIHRGRVQSSTPATISITAGDGGSVDKTSVSTFVGAQVTVTATPNGGYGFQGWYVSGASVSSKTEYTFTVEGNLSMEARFSQSSYAPGDISITPTSQTYDAGTPKLTATADSDIKWVEGDAYTAKTTTFTVSVGKAGSPAEYSYEWYCNGTKISGADQASYTTPKMYTAGKYSYFCKVTNGVGSAVESNTAVVTVKAINWKVKVLKSTKLKFTEMPTTKIDVFLVGGGGSGVKAPLVMNGERYHGGGGGCGGYTKTQKSVPVEKNREYEIVIGSGGVPSSDGYTGKDGNKTTAFGYTANGGDKGSSSGNDAGHGGSGGGGQSKWESPYSGGNGGSDGSAGSKGTYTATRTYGYGQGTTTREFGESGATVYAGGGGGAGANAGTTSVGPGGTGGTGGGGRGAGSGGVAKSGTSNTGGGGGGACQIVSTTPGSGGSGVVIIRNER